jgi:hypothetical protein
MKETRRLDAPVPGDYEPPVALATGPVAADGLPIRLRRITE